MRPFAFLGLTVRLGPSARAKGSLAPFPSPGVADRREESISEIHARRSKGGTFAGAATWSAHCSRKSTGHVTSVRPSNQSLAEVGSL